MVQLATGTSGFGRFEVSGRNREPIPPARTTAIYSLSTMNTAFITPLGVNASEKCQVMNRRFPSGKSLIIERD